MKYPGRVTGINERTVWLSNRASASLVTVSNPTVIKSMVEFELDENTRLNVEIEGEHPIGTKFEMDINQVP